MSFIKRCASDGWKEVIFSLEIIFQKNEALKNAPPSG